MGYFRTREENIQYPKEVNTTEKEIIWIHKKIGNDTNEYLLSYFYTRPADELYIVELVSNIFLAIEWLVRFSVSPDRLAFMKSFLNIVDLLSILIMVSMLIMFNFIDIHEMWYSNINVVYKIWDIVFSVRILRLFRMSRYNEGMKLLLMSISACINELCMLLLAFACFALIFGTCIYMCELYGERPIPDLMSATYWAIITMTTVGYGDIFPVTMEGYVVGILCCLTGVVLTALPVVVTSTNFYDYYSLNTYRRRHLEEKNQADNT